uniref:RNA polymerase beta subunit n=1 Tax=Equisetum diffusum TaxID=231682 RepID=UPI0030FEF635
MSTGKKQGTFVPPEFGRIQSEEFLRLVDQGIVDELTSFPKIEDGEKDCEFCLFGEEYRFTESIVQEQDAIYECSTYSSDLYVLAQLSNRKNRTIKRQVVLLCSLPLFTSQGFFIINGVARVVVSQILRSPGIYYSREFDHKGFPLYTGTIISNLGGRFKFELDKKARIWARVSKKRKVSIFILLFAIGFKPRDIFNDFNYPEILIKFFKRQVRDIHSV